MLPEPRKDGDRLRLDPESEHLGGYGAELRDRPTAEVTRNAQGQSLDDARTAFRTEWRAKLLRIQQAAEQARKRHKRWNDLLAKGFFGCVGLGAVFGLRAVAFAKTSQGFLVFLFCILFGAILALPWVCLCSVLAENSQIQAKRLEREALRMEQG